MHSKWITLAIVLLLAFGNICESRFLSKPKSNKTANNDENKHNPITNGTNSYDEEEESDGGMRSLLDWLKDILFGNKNGNRIDKFKDWLKDRYNRTGNMEDYDEGDFFDGDDKEYENEGEDFEGIDESKDEEEIGGADEENEDEDDEEWSWNWPWGDDGEEEEEEEEERELEDTDKDSEESSESWNMFNDLFEFFTGSSEGDNDDKQVDKEDKDRYDDNEEDRHEDDDAYEGEGEYNEDEDDEYYDDEDENEEDREEINNGEAEEKELEEEAEELEEKLSGDKGEEEENKSFWDFFF
ncbi:hypothetical protein TrispH2_005750 [Trichoplax sp. H2]|nr:hypothetical protein TrispH2_005750 [Trichoplax sp. H2]|eukprot:RDD42119.1 hypothetical protein TrispH2_005750 [Trichoplax sp. H2]